VTREKCSALDAGGYVSCASVDGGRIIYLEGFKGEIGLPATDATPAMTVKVTEASSLHVLEGRAISADAQDQDAVGEAITTLANGVVKLSGAAGAP
jgi:hypothetical protein